MDESERVELEADIEKIHHTLEADRSQWQFDEYDDSDEDSEEEDNLYIDLERQPSASVSVTSLSARSGGGRTTPSAQSLGSRQTGESEAAEQDEDADNLFREVGVVLDQVNSTSDLPTSLSTCLALNHAYQDLINDHISQIELALAENREAQKLLEEEATDTSKQLPTKKRFPYSMAAPYFKQGQSSCPPVNGDVHQKHVIKEPDLDRRPDIPWNQRFRRMLLDAVKEDALEKLLKPLFIRRELEEGKLQDAEENSGRWQSSREKISSIEKEIEKKKSTSDEQLLRDLDVERVDWMKISNLTFNGKRDWRSCKRAWLHMVDPSINHEPMQPAEEKRLLELVRETKGGNWVYIAQQLGTGRTAFQCLQYYQQNLNTKMLNRPWTEAEDQRLLKVVEKSQQCHFNWHKVSQYMEGRSHTQCYKRFSKIDPNKNTGYWTEVEDAQLIAAVQLLGSYNWGKIQELVPTRSREQCRERYLNSLDPSLSGRPWSYEEDKQLLQLVQKYGKGKWVKISRELPGRTDNQILQRYRRLEDWGQKTEWFQSQSPVIRDLLQGKNMPRDKQDAAYRANWDQFHKVFAVVQEDYAKQQADLMKGDVVVPRPPFLLGLASKGAQKVWDRRVQLHMLVEMHVQKLREKFQSSSSHPYDLQDAVKNLSYDVVSSGALERLRQEQVAELLPQRPTNVNVSDLLAIARGVMPPSARVVRPQCNTPTQRRKDKEEKEPHVEVSRPKFKKVCEVESELKQVMRMKLREPMIKHGRPRKFFWRDTKEQLLSEKELGAIRADSLNLYLKSLGADPSRLLAAARNSFPELASKHRAQATAAMAGSREEGRSEEGNEDVSRVAELSDNSNRELPRSRRTRKPKAARDIAQMESSPRELEDPAMKKKLKDYETLEWMCRVLGVPAMTSPAQVCTDPDPQRVQTVDGRGQGSGGSHDGASAGVLSGNAATPVAVRHGVADLQNSQVNSTPQQSEIYSEKPATVTRKISAAPTELSASSTRNASTSPKKVVVPPPRPARLPSLPPTSATLQSFKLLLLQRRELINRAGSYYDLTYYESRKDSLMAQIIRAGKHLEILNKRSEDLGRVMSRVSQNSEASRKGRKPKARGLTASENIALEMEDPSVVQELRKTEAYRLLQARFQAVCLWPALLSAIYPPFKRQDFSIKAASGEHQGAQAAPEVLQNTWQTMRRLPPMLKSKQFYKFATKSRREKKSILDKRQKNSILKQVRALLDDENDPDPVITMDSDSDDQPALREPASAPCSGQQALPRAGVLPAGPSQQELPSSVAVISKKGDVVVSSEQALPHSDCLSAGTSAPSLGKAESAAHRPRRRKRSACSSERQPVRKSQRRMQRTTYEDRLNKKRPRPTARQPPAARGTATGARQQRVHRSRFLRQFLIDVMVRMKEEPESATARGAWRPDWCDSDSDEEFPSQVHEQSGNWLAELPAAQKDSLLQLEKETAVAGQKPASVPASVPATSLQANSSSSSDVQAVPPGAARCLQTARVGRPVTCQGRDVSPRCDLSSLAPQSGGSLVLEPPSQSLGVGMEAGGGAASD